MDHAKSSGKPPRPVYQKFSEPLTEQKVLSDTGSQTQVSPVQPTPVGKAYTHGRRQLRSTLKSQLKRKSNDDILSVTSLKGANKK